MPTFNELLAAISAMPAEERTRLLQEAAMPAPVELHYEQPIRLAEWTAGHATVFTIEGYARKAGEDPEKALARARERGHAIAGSIHTGFALVNDGGRHAAKQRQLFDLAVVLRPGQEVEIEGRRYTVAVPSSQYGRTPKVSDPISFIPVEG